MKMEQILIKVFSGISIEDKCGKQLHPINEAKKAKTIVDKGESIEIYSNSPDFISIIKYYSLDKNINLEFYLDGTYLGDEIEPIFKEFNKAFDDE